MTEPQLVGRDEVEVAHEALIRHWPRLRAWLDQDRAALLLRETIREAALEWERNGLDDAFLTHRGRRLVAAEALLHHQRLELNALERDYLNAAIALREREEGEQEAQRQRELAAQRERAEMAELHAAEQMKANRRGRILTAVAVVAALVAGFFGWRAAQSADEAKSQRVTAEAEANRAKSLLYSLQAPRQPDVEAGVLLAVEAMNNEHTPEATQALLEEVSQSPRASRTWPDPAATLEAGEGEIRSAVLSSDLSSKRQHLIAGDATGRVTLWEISDPELNTEASVKTSRTVWAGAVRGIAFPPESLPIAVAGDGGVRLLAPSTLADQTIISESPATSVVYMPTAEEYVYGNADGSVTRYTIDPPQRATLEDATGRGGVAVNAVAVSTLDWVAAGRDDGTVQLWDATGSVIPLVPAPQARGATTGEVASQPASINYLTFDRAGNRLAAGDSQGKIWQWDLDLNSRSATARNPLTQGDDAIVSVSYWLVNTAMTVVDEGGQVVLWDTDQAEKLKVETLKPGTRSVAIPPWGGSPVASGGDDGKVYLWIQVWTVFSTKEPLALEAGPLSAVAFSDSDRLLVGEENGTVQMCDRSVVPISCQIVATDLGRISSLVLSHDGQLLASADDKGAVVLQSLAGGRGDHSLSAGMGVTSLAFSADDQRLIASLEVPPRAGGVSSTGQIKVWDLSALPSSPTEVPPPASGPSTLGSLDAKPIGVIRSLAVDGIGDRVAVAAGGDGITWELGANTPVLIPAGRAQKTRSLSFSPDGSQLASGHSDGWLVLWKTENDRSSTPLGRLKAPIIALGWFDAETIVAVGADGSVVEFSLDPEFLKTQACEVAGRDFTQVESRQFFDEDVYRACH